MTEHEYEYEYCIRPKKIQQGEREPVWDLRFEILDLKFEVLNGRRVWNK